MSRRVRLMSLAALAALAAVLLWATQPREPRHRSRRDSSLARLFAPARIPPLASQPPRRSAHNAAADAARPRGPSSPDTVARAFLSGWLACTYHRGPCSSLPESLAAYRAALSRQHDGALATPAEQAAHPRVVAVRITRSCGGSAIALATFTDGEGGDFQLHLNLVLEPVGWRVFDVAEAPPHIPPPKPLSRGPLAC